MKLRTRPFRIFEADQAPLRLLAELRHVSPAEVFHKALAEYLANHREELSTAFTETQRAIAAGDLGGLTRLLTRGAAAHAEDLMAEIDEVRG